MQANAIGVRFRFKQHFHNRHVALASSNVQKNRTGAVFALMFGSPPSARYAPVQRSELARADESAVRPQTCTRARTRLLA